MQAVESSHVSAPATGFPSEARGISGIFHRQLIITQDHIAVKISDGYFSCWDKIKFILRDEIHLPFLVRKLPCTITGSFIHNDGRLYLTVSLFFGFIQKKVY